jgi:hypothetical protein
MTDTAVTTELPAKTSELFALLGSRLAPDWRVLNYAIVTWFDILELEYK